MPGRHEVRSKLVVDDVAARIAGIDLLHTEAGQVHGKLEHRRRACSRLLADGERVAGVILMAMGQRHMGDALVASCTRQSRCLESGLPVRNGSIRMLDCAVSMRKQEWPNQVIFIG